MRTITRKKRTSPRYRVGDKVSTLRGDGRIVSIFPNGPHRKTTYAVKVGRSRFGIVFDENEISAVGEIKPPSRKSG